MTRNYLRDLRKKKDVSKAMVAKELGVTEQYYGFIENGRRGNKMPLEVAYKLSVYFGIGLVDFAEMELEYKKGA